MEQIKICYFSATAAELPCLSRAVSRLADEKVVPTVVARTRTQLFDRSRVDAFVEEALTANAVVLSLHGGKESCPAYVPLVSALRERRASGAEVPYLHIQPTGGDEEAVLAAREDSDGVEGGPWRGLTQLFNRGGTGNLEKALRFLTHVSTRPNVPVPEAEPISQEGIYHPDLGHVKDPAQYFATHIDPRKTTIGIWFHQTYWLNDNLANIDALVREVEARGANALPVFSSRLRDVELGNMGCDQVVETYFMKEDGSPRLDALINVISMSMTLTEPDFRRVFPRLNVPVLQAMTSTLPYRAWKESLQGVSIMDVTFQAAQPEFDGNLIVVPTASREEDEVDPLTGALLSRFVPIPERTGKLVLLALNWAKLGRLDNAEKRVAVIFHHYPPRNDRIGCAAGLDTFESVRLLLETMKDAGYGVDHLYGESKELSDAMLERMTCDQRWLSPHEMAARSEASAGREVFLPWHQTLPEAVREKMCSAWGETPGDLFVHEDKFLFAGLLNGNVFLTIQPPRGYLENVDAILHDLYLPPPHHYLAQYRWIRDVFKADAVIHVGKHGSLEWLPGKALGLSEECYPDLSIMDLPNVYPYIINDPGEGTQAKRRSYCCIVDHLTPAFTNADLYEELADVERALADYTDATRQDPGKVPILAGLLWDSVVKADLHHDLGMIGEDALNDREAFVSRLHGYLSELADTMINDGLHTLGRPPEGDRLTEFLVQLTRLGNGEVPSLREEIARSKGYQYDDLMDHRGEARFSGKTGGQVIAEVHEQAVAMAHDLAGRGFDASAADDLVRKHCGGGYPGIAEVLRYIAGTLLDNVKGAEQEIGAVMTALEGGFVLPGPSGTPTRGQADILPTGRNFFSVDPRAIPSKGAWEVGKALGDALLERCLEETGRYPENLGIIVWGCPTMRSKGDDVAEVLYLLGLRPLWQTNGIVKGLEIIPLSELGRPRIDVTPRISGFFRDAFPLLVNMIDDAVTMVAALDEAPENNLVRRHVLADQATYREDGISEQDAWRMATLRIFGCPPGTYGAGVEELIESKAWETREDLANNYIRYSAHAYGRGSYGAQKPKVFRKLLARMDVTVKNEDTREYDMYSCTDFYNYYGGLIAAAGVVRGEMPFALTGDSSDPRRVVMRTTQEETKHVLRSRLLNPKWLEGMKRHGYKGAGDISKVMDIIIGWDATSDTMEDWMYDRVAERYALDPAMREWFKKMNPYALQNIIDKLLETIQRGMWQATDEMEKKLRDAYLDIEGEIEEAIEGETERSLVESAHS
jgi:cobaltochelatase CobN